MIRASITLPDEQDHIRRLFAAEQHVMLNDRASYEVARDGRETIISLTARDATALRAVMNSVCKTLIVYEKVTQVMTYESGRGDETTRADRTNT